MLLSAEKAVLEVRDLNMFYIIITMCSSVVVTLWRATSVHQGDDQPIHVANKIPIALFRLLVILDVCVIVMGNLYPAHCERVVLCGHTVKAYIVSNTS